MRKTKLILTIISAAMLLSVLVIAAGALNSPSTCSGGWNDCTNAFADDSSRATINTAAPVHGQWNDYGFSIAAGSTIDNVTVQVDFFASRDNGFIDVTVSGDGGLTYGAPHTVGGNTVEQSFFIEVTDDLSWTPDMLTDANLRVNVSCFKQGGGPKPTCNLDWAPVLVNYTESVEDFDFSISLNPTTDSVEQGESSTTDVSVTLLNGTTQNVTLSHAGCPTGATCSFIQDSGFPTYNSNFTVATSGSTPEGIYLVNVTGTNGTLSKTATFTLNVTAFVEFNFSLSLSPSEDNVVQSNSTSTNVSVILESGTPENVDLTFAGCPSSANCTIIPASGTPTYSSTFMVNTSPCTPLGTYPINITGTSTNLSRTVVYTLNVTQLCM